MKRLSDLCSSIEQHAADSDKTRMLEWQEEVHILIMEVEAIYQAAT